MSQQASQFVGRYWLDILLLVGLVGIACAFTVCHIIDRTRKKRSGPDKPDDTIDYEKPPFEVDHSPGGNCDSR